MMVKMPKSFPLLLVLFSSLTTPATAQPECADDFFTCPDGSLVERVPPDCDFRPCAGGVACTQDIFVCPSGTEVVRVPPLCEFEECPGCPGDTFVCDDGTVLDRDPATNCEFPLCPKPVACNQDIFVCDDGTELVRDPELNCDFPMCPPQACTQDVFTCDDGTVLSRDPDLDCEFPPCPPQVCTQDVFTCDDGTVLSRDPDMNCEFPDCPPPACAQDAFTCPDGTVLSRDPDMNCDFPPCPQVCAADIFVCNDGTELIRDPELDCDFPDCPCPQDVFVCDDGTELTRTEAGCEFPECPPPACTLDTFTCDDGTVVSRVPPDCEFEDCPPVVCNGDVVQCPDGSFVGRSPPLCEFDECPEIEACTADVFECPDGSFVSRVPPECDFAPCGPPVCNADIMQCPGGGFVERDPNLDCEFPPCPLPGVCALDVLECPGGIFLSRDPEMDCAFPPCPTMEYFMLAAFTDGCIGRRDFMAGTELLLKECSFEDDAVLWRLDLDGRFRSKSDDTMCIQAGQLPAISFGVDGLMSGTSMYLKPCNDNLKLELQVFDDSFTLGGMTGPLFLQARDDLCVVHFGAVPMVGEDRIMLLPCNQLGGERALGWTALYPDYNYVTLRASAGGCLARKDQGDGGDDLFLKSCSSDDINLQWRLDPEGRFRSKADDSECMQAGQYPGILNGPDGLMRGTPMYAKGCDGPLKPPFQTMAVPALYATQGTSVQGPIRLASRPDLCVTHFGAMPEIGESRIILIECSSLGGDRGQGWTAENPCVHAPFCQPATLPSMAKSP